MGENVTKRQYQPYFCEENVWHLAQNISGTVLFVSNRKKTVALWRQDLAPDHEKPVIWDYHVVLASRGMIYDLETNLPYPCPSKLYFEETFRPLGLYISAEFRPNFRLISTTDYSTRFHSDRSHMQNEQGHWLALPPIWNPIVNKSPNALPLVRLFDFEDYRTTDLQSLPKILDAIYLKTAWGRDASLVVPTPSCP